MTHKEIIQKEVEAMQIGLMMIIELAIWLTRVSCSRFISTNQ